MLAGNIGYLRVPAHRGELADRLVTELPALMAQFRNTDALIVDARQGGGGQRKVLNALFPYFMCADAKPYVFNVVKLRKHAVQSDPAKMFDDPDKRFWYIPDPNVPADEMLAYRQLLKGFIPAWNPPASESVSYTHLDVYKRQDVMTELARDGMTMLCVTHEMGFARKVANRVIFMDAGKIIEDCASEAFFLSLIHI